MSTPPLSGAVTFTSAVLMLLGSSCTWCPADPQRDTEQEVSPEFLDALADEEGVDDWNEIDCEALCSDEVEEDVGDSGDFEFVADCDLRSKRGETVRVECTIAFDSDCKGRRPLGFRSAPVRLHALARAAWLEAASVFAFEELADSLRRFGAPTSLVERCLVAADEERRDARWVAALARRDGAEIAWPRRRPRRSSLVQVALHNAVEGCVNEAWGAVEACLAAQGTGVEAAVFGRLARDELRHAQLAWDLHAWFGTKLEPDDRARVAAAQRGAIVELGRWSRREHRRLAVPFAHVLSAMT